MGSSVTAEVKGVRVESAVEVIRFLADDFESRTDDERVASLQSLLPFLGGIAWQERKLEHRAARAIEALPSEAIADLEVIFTGQPREFGPRDSAAAYSEALYNRIEQDNI